jgi:hypothetical protein
MKRRFQGLASTAQATGEVPDGAFLARVEQVRYCRERQKPYYSLVFSVLEPEPLVGRRFSGRLYCTAKALWKLTWFLRDFSYDAELLGRDEIDDQALVGLRGVVKISHAVVNGHAVVNLDAFAPAGAWESISPVTPLVRAEAAS